MYYDREPEWAAKAEALRPQLFRRTVYPAARIETVKDSSVWQGYSVRQIGLPEDVFGQELPESWEFCFDFGEYCVGYLSFDFDFVKPVDAPFRLEVKMAETPFELAYDFSSYNAPLGRGWLQEALVIEDAPAKTITLPRRYAFRYLKLKVSCNSVFYKVILRGIRCETVSSAQDAAVLPVTDTDPLMQKIDRVGLKTLHSCMQEVFEDGPKRDRRLWLGDLRIQALANYQTFRHYDLVKRCLYLFAAAADENGRIAGCIYSDGARPVGGSYLYDYGILFGDMLLDYAKASGDAECARELFPVAERQCRMELTDGAFIDWKTELDKECAQACVTLYANMRLYELAQFLDCEELLADIPGKISQLRQEIRQKYFDGTAGYFVSGEQKQISYASQVWAAYAQVLPPEETRELLRKTLKNTDAVQPGGPFMYNQLVLALEKSGLFEEARHLTRAYWGKMVEYGADRFWEVFDPADPMKAPFDEPASNSHCHAWSTPVLRRITE